MGTSRFGWTIFFSLVTGALGHGQKTPDVRLSVGSAPGSAYRGDPCLAVSGSTVYAAWFDQRDGMGDVYFNRSLDRGATWLSDDVRIDTAYPPGAADSRHVTLAAEGEAVYAAWFEAGDDAFGIFFNRSLDGGATWLDSAVRLTDVGLTLTCDYPQLAAIGSSVYVLWWEWRGEPHNVYFRESADRGAHWSGAITLDRGNPRPNIVRFEPRLAATPSAVYVVWPDHRNGRKDIYLDRRLHGGSWLGSAVRLDVGTLPGAADSTGPHIAATGSGVFVAWSDTRDGEADVYFNRSLDGGLTWLPLDLRLDRARPPGERGSYVQAIAAAEESVYVAWNEQVSPVFTRNDTYFNRSVDAGQSWERSEVRLGHGPAYAATLRASGPCVYAAWSEYRAGPDWNVLFNRSLDHGATWLARDVPVSSGPPDTTHAPGLALSGSSVYAIWGDTRNGIAPDIYFTLMLGPQPYGEGLAGSGGLVPLLSCTGRSSIGGELVVGIERGRGAAPAVLVLGFDGPAAIPSAGGLLLVRPPLFTKSVELSGSKGVAGAGSVVIGLDIPADPGLIGRRFNMQAAVLDPVAPAGLALSAAIESWIL